MGILDHLRSRQLISFHAEAGGLRFSIHATQDLADEARASAMKHWEQLESYVVKHSAFKTSFVPLPISGDAPSVVRAMSEAADLTRVGPMVAMPGALVEEIARDLSELAKEVIVSTEGDVFMIGERTRTFVVDPATHDENHSVAVKVHSNGERAFFASSGRVRVDPFIGNARVVAVVAERGALAAAAGSAMGYAMHRPNDVERALEVAKTTPGVLGALVLGETNIGVWGEIEIVTTPTTA